MDIQQALVECGFILAPTKTLSPQQVKARFISQGIQVSDWAKDNGFRPHAVYQVLNGFTKANRGSAHKIAVALGIKADPNQHIA